ncbi:ABC transporter permease [Sporosarcina sp. ACRSL]|uniref:ABC transporter permease n=1 Tax=Sporosarcina sp. ACRSL TaxID=2918215 RepID=UPI001EF48CDB|nr:ABC transporter permease [Sporosarcina sp. ACRSL]MCG7344003.1 ABC transporter permease [Sporosarcina sp. ACRSL]
MVVKPLVKNRANSIRWTDLYALTKHPGFWSIFTGGLVVLILILSAVFAPIIATHPPDQQVLSDRLLPVSWAEGGSAAHILGTDTLGRDIFSRILYGARISLTVGLAAAIGAGIIGTTFGLISGFYGGKIDYIVQKIVEVFQSFPFLLLAISIMAISGQSLGILILVLILQRWVEYCRVVRGETLSLKSREYVQAAKTMGAKNYFAIIRHILPNSVAPVIIIATYSLASSIITESSLSFLGMGVPPHIPTWGSMLSEGRDYMYAAPWLSIIPGICIFVTVIAVNLLGDGVRDWFDPSIRGRS